MTCAGLRSRGGLRLGLSLGLCLAFCCDLTPLGWCGLYLVLEEVAEALHLLFALHLQPFSLYGGVHDSEEEFIRLVFMSPLEPIIVGNVVLEHG